MSPDPYMRFKSWTKRSTIDSVDGLNGFEICAFSSKVCSEFPFYCISIQLCISFVWKKDVVGLVSTLAS